MQVKPISVNSPTQLSAQITRAPNVPFPGIWFPIPPPPTPSHSVKIQKRASTESKQPAQHGAGWASPDSELEPPPPALGQPPDGNVR